MTVRPVFDDRYLIEGVEELSTPAVAVYPELIGENLSAALRMIGDPARMRPHVKTHKTRELVRLEIDAGVYKHKCATLAEAEMLADIGVSDIVLAYTLVGPNIRRFARLQRHFRDCSFKVLGDHHGPLAELGAVMSNQGQTAEVLLDLDTGMGRTGVPLGARSVALYRMLATTPGLRPAGLHVYDGQNHQSDPVARAAGVDAVWKQVSTLVADLEAVGLAVPGLVCGNSASYPRWAQLAAEEPRIECSPGTFFLNDWNYYHWFEDIPLKPAAVLLTRVVSKPRPDRLTLDLGYKAVASDALLEDRVRFLNIEDARIALQNEEHLVIDSKQAAGVEPGDLLYAWPAHICPTCALHRELLVIESHRCTGTWQVAARDRAEQLTDASLALRNDS